MKPKVINDKFKAAMALMAKIEAAGHNIEQIVQIVADADPLVFNALDDLVKTAGVTIDTPVGISVQDGEKSVVVPSLADAYALSLIPDGQAGIIAHIPEFNPDKTLVALLKSSIFTREVKSPLGNTITTAETKIPHHVAANLVGRKPGSPFWAHTSDGPELWRVWDVGDTPNPVNATGILFPGPSLEEVKADALHWDFWRRSQKAVANGLMAYTHTTDVPYYIAHNLLYTPAGTPFYDVATYYDHDVGTHYEWRITPRDAAKSPAAEIKPFKFLHNEGPPQKEADAGDTFHWPQLPPLADIYPSLGFVPETTPGVAPKPLTPMDVGPELSRSAEEIKATAAKISGAEGTREHWQVIGAALLRARDLCASSKSFGEWVKFNGIHKLPGLATPSSRSDAVWLAERDACAEKIPTSIAHPRRVRTAWRKLLKENAKQAVKLHSTLMADRVYFIVMATSAWESEAIDALQAALDAAEKAEANDTSPDPTAALDALLSAFAVAQDSGVSPAAAMQAGQVGYGLYLWQQTAKKTYFGKGPFDHVQAGPTPHFAIAHTFKALVEHFGASASHVYEAGADYFGADWPSEVAPNGFEHVAGAVPLNKPILALLALQNLYGTTAEQVMEAIFSVYGTPAPKAKTKTKGPANIFAALAAAPNPDKALLVLHGLAKEYGVTAEQVVDAIPLAFGSGPDDVFAYVKKTFGEMWEPIGVKSGPWGNMPADLGPVETTVAAFGVLAAHHQVTLEDADTAITTAWYIGAEQAAARLRAALKLAAEKAMTMGEAKDMVVEIFWEEK